MRSGDAHEQFAKAQFLDMSDADKLSQRAFDPLNGGAAAVVRRRSSSARRRLAKRRVRYEQIIIDSNYLRFRRRFKLFTRGFFDHFLKGAAVTQVDAVEALQDAARSVRRQGEGHRRRVHRRAHGEQSALQRAVVIFASEAQAQQYIATQVARTPELHDSLHVMPQYEAAA